LHSGKVKPCCANDEVIVTPAPATPLFMSSRIVCRIIDAAARRGVDPLDLYRATEIDPKDVRDVDAQIGIERYLLLWRAVIERIKDPGFPLYVAESWNETHNLLRFLCISSADLGEALTRASRYLRVITNAVSWPLEQIGDAMVLSMVRQSSAQAPELRYAEEFGAAEIVTLARAFTGLPWKPRLVRFTFAEPSDSTSLRTFFSAPLEFGAERCEIHFSLESLRLPLLKADAATVAFFEPYVEKIIRADPAVAGEPRVADDVKVVLMDTLRGDAPTLEEVAAVLNTSGRTLRRRLQGEGVTFQGVLDEVRLTLATKHIQQGTLALAEISFLLGFSEPSAFHRAFRRWTGTTPQSYARTRRNAPI
jgi:AraC-like DNA-binding protein